MATSIDKQQREQTHQDLAGAAAIDKVRKLVEAAKTCFFCTNIRSGGFSARPMSVQLVDERGWFWFLSPSDSQTNADLRRVDEVQLLFQGSSHAEFLTLHGKAVVSKDRAKIKELWKPILKDWFTEGEGDPRITVICVRPHDGHYWDTRHGLVIAAAKRLVGAVTGKTMDDSLEGRLKM